MTTKLTTADYEGKSASEILAMKAGQAPEMKGMPVGKYLAQLTGWKEGVSAKKKTPFIAAQIRMTAAGSDVDTDELDGSTFPKDIEYPFWLSPKSMGMLDDFLVNTMGAIADGQDEEDYMDVLQRLVGQQVGVIYSEETIPADPSQGREARVITRPNALCPADDVG